MVVADTNYLETLSKIEQLKNLIFEIQKDIYNQIPQGITNQFDSSTISFLDIVDDIEVTLIEFHHNIHGIYG